MPIFSTLNPALRTLAATVGASYGLQLAAAAVAVPLQTEKFFDLLGSVGFVSATWFSLYYPHLQAYRLKGTPLPGLGSFHPRQLIVSSLVTIWGVRLGSFLFQRVMKSGSDSRFDEIKKQPAKFTAVWVGQATWITLTCLPVLITNSIPKARQAPIGIRDYAGIALWFGGFLFEVIADRQKSSWREAKNAKKHEEKFISSGLWGVSRHPNYVGETTLWWAQYLISTSVLYPTARTAGLYPGYTVALAALGPAFEFALLRYGSGVPPLEESGDKKYGDDPKWHEYKKNVPIFFPKPF